MTPAQQRALDASRTVGYATSSHFMQCYHVGGRRLNGEMIRRMVRDGVLRYVNIKPGQPYPSGRTVNASRVGVTIVVPAEAPQ